MHARTAHTDISLISYPYHFGVWEWDLYLSSRNCNTCIPVLAT